MRHPKNYTKQQKAALKIPQSDGKAAIPSQNFPQTFPKPSQNPSQTLPKLSPRAPKTLPNPLKIQIFIECSLGTLFGSILRALKPPKPSQKPAQNLPKSMPKRCPKTLHFLRPFVIDFYRFWISKAMLFCIHVAHFFPASAKDANPQKHAFSLSKITIFKVSSFKKKQEKYQKNL